MPTIFTSTTVTIPAGQKLTIKGTGAIATATVNPGSLGQIYTVGNDQDIFGPFTKATSVYIQIQSGSVTYSFIDYGAVNALTSGGQVLTPSGDVVGGGVAEWVPFVRTQAAAVVLDAYKVTQRPVDTTVAALTTATPSLPGGTAYYIDPLHASASNSNAGTSPSLPWATLEKLVGLNPGAGATIYLAADATFEHGVTRAQYMSRTVFTFNGGDNFSGSSGNPVTIRPYYPRPSSGMPTVRYYCETVAGDWTQETAMLGGKVWSIAVSGAVNGNTCFAVFGSDERVGLNPKAALGAAYGHDPLNMYAADQFSMVLNSPTKLFVYVPDGTNPISYYGKVRIGGLAILQSSWNGLRYVRITGIKFELCCPVWSLSQANTSSGACVGLEIDNCWFNKSQALNYANRTTNATALEGEVKVHDNLFTDTPICGVHFQPCTGTAGNTVQWRVYQNRVYTSCISTSDKAWFYNQCVGGTFYRAWANYGYDCRNGAGGNAIDGCLLYADLSSSNSEFVGNVAEWCGVAFQSNNSINCTITANVAVDCVKLAQITASTDGSVTTMSTRCSHNTWLYTGRRAIPQRGPNVALGSPIIAWNDKAAASGATYKFTRLEIINNALLDFSGEFATREAAKYAGTQATTLVVGGFAIAGFGSVKVADYGTDMTQVPTDKTTTPWVVRVSGDSSNGGWVTSAETGAAAPSFDSPLRGAGVPISPAHTDFAGVAFSATAPDIGAIAWAS